MYGITAFTYLLLQLSTLAFGAVTWPSSYDELEDIMLLNQGYKARQLSLPVTPCNFQRAPGFIPAAGFVRTAFHDVAPHNAATGQGGLDASIAFELTGEPGKDNAGPFVNNTLTFLSRFYSTESSMSDLLSLAVYTAVRGCGGPSISIRTGRKDAQAAGALGVPKVEGTEQELKRDFTRMGFTSQEMVKLVACGHTLGGVHSAQFPQIVANGSQPNNVQNFDSSPAVYDNHVAVEFVTNTSNNPLVVGPERTNSDTKVYTVDGGVTIRQLADAQNFQDSCKAILQKMLETIPAGNKLTEPIEVYDIKPGAIQLAVTNDGKTLNFTGEIRVRTTKLPQSSIGSVVLVYKTRSGGPGDKITTQVVGTAAGYDESFTFYSFSASIDAKSSISSFDVVITGTDGSSKTFNNNGKSYPVQDKIFVQHPKCFFGAPDAGGKQQAKIVIAVKGTASGVKIVSHTQTARSVPFPLLTSDEVTVKKEASAGDYTYYSGLLSVTPAQINSTTFDISALIDGKTTESRFHKIARFGLPTNGGNGTDGGDGGNGTHSTTTTSGGSSSPTSGGNGRPFWTDWSAPPAATTIGSPMYPIGGGSGDDSGPHRPYRPCGPNEGCDAADWATETVWIVPTQGPLAHTKPAGVYTDKPTPGAGGVPVPVPVASGDQDAGHGHGNGAAPTILPKPPVPTPVAGGGESSSVLGGKPVAPSKPVAEFTGGATRGAVGAVGVLVAAAAVLL